MRGRKPVAVFVYENRHMAETATIATNKGVYVVESLCNGLYYFLEDDNVIMATSGGHMRVDLETAETIASELSGIIADFRKDKREGRKPMTTRNISKMLEEQ